MVSLHEEKEQPDWKWKERQGAEIVGTPKGGEFVVVI